MSICRRLPLRAWFAALGLGCLGLVAVGLELQALWRLAPCPLCIFQRFLDLLIGLVGVLGFALPAARLLWSALIGGLAALGIGVAAYQSWMQAFPEQAIECSYTNPNPIERLVDWLGMQWPDLFLATGFCTSKEWVFLDLSLANWSVLVYAALLAMAVWLARRPR